MNVPVQTEAVKNESMLSVPVGPTVHQGIPTVNGHDVEYVVLQPAPTQWVVMALVTCDVETPRMLVVTEGRCRNEALKRLAQRLHQDATPKDLTAFATDWAMGGAEL